MALPDPGTRAARRHVVTDHDTAAALGSGDVPALATPRLLAWCEAATVEALASGLPDDTTSVGTRMSLEHLHPTPVGAAIDVSAVLSHTDGRLLRFEVVAHDAGGKVIAHGDITRVAVGRDRFLSRLR
ncbi:MAG: thioesterase [Nocardioidaceae bacterium]|nr:thioesterase [Nocardioidaceae bacterium]